MQYTEDIGCLTQRSQLDRLQELADGITRERVKTLQSSDLLATIVLVIGPSGKESTWDLDHLPMARSANEPAVQLSLDPDAALDNLVPTQAIMRILRDTAASAVALIAPVNGSAAALQLADIDHEQSLTARINRQPDREPSLGQWDFGKVAWTVRLRHVLRAEALREGDPAALLQTVNRILLREQPGDEQLCSICCAVLRPRAGRLHATVASAGHPPPVVLRSDGSVAPLDVGGTVLGAIEKPEVEIAKKTLQPGDAIAFYTDGLTEARSPEGEFFGEAGLEAALKGRGAISAQTIVDDLMSAVVQFSGGAPRDDLALLAISVPEGADAKRPSN